MFGDEQTELLFELNATVPGHTYRVLLASDQLKLRRVNLHMGYQPGPEPVEHEEASQITLEGGRSGYLSEMTVLTPSEIETAASAYVPGESYHGYWLQKVEAREKEIAGLGVDKGFNRDFFRTGPLSRGDGGHARLSG